MVEPITTQGIETDDQSSVCRLLIDPPADGAWNMAVDEALLIETAQTETPTLRLYQWQSPTLSLGYFQRHEDRIQHSSSLAAEVVRRWSGGGAILHDRELTYSIVLPAAHPFARDTQTLYRTVHQAIIGLLERLLSSVATEWQFKSCVQSAPGEQTAEPFLCFQRRSPGDVLLRPTKQSGNSLDYKILGSAQRRRRGVVLQHGSLLLNRSLMAPDLPGINDLLQSSLSPAEIIESMPQALAIALGVSLHQDAATACYERAAAIAANRYRDSSWSRRR